MMGTRVVNVGEAKVKANRLGKLLPVLVAAAVGSRAQVLTTLKVRNRLDRGGVAPAHHPENQVEAITAMKFADSSNKVAATSVIIAPTAMVVDPIHQKPVADRQRESPLELLLRQQ